MSERRAAEEGSDGPEPTESAPRLKRQGAGPDERPTRVSVRPSAFGPPRPSSRPPAEPRASRELELPADSDTDEPTPGSGISQVPPAARPQRPSTVEQLAREDHEQRDSVSNSQFATRLRQLPPPEPPRVSGPGRSRARRPLLSIAVFTGMLALSALSLLRYFKQPETAETGQDAALRDDTALEARHEPPHPVASGSNESGSMVAEQGSAEARQQTIMALVAEANRALEAGNAPQAERLFGQVVAIDEDNPRAAFGLSRIRLLQGNLSGAEGWIQLAIRKRPRRAAYHAHYAAILERLGNHAEAREELERAQGGSEVDE